MWLLQEYAPVHHNKRILMSDSIKNRIITAFSEITNEMLNVLMSFQESLELSINAKSILALIDLICIVK